MSFREELDKLNIGDCFMIGDKKYKIVENTNCDECDLELGCPTLDWYNMRPECSKFQRHDKKDVIFVEVE